MFEIDPATSWIDPAAGPVSALIQSLNTPLVAAGEHPAEAVQSWIVSRQAATGLFDVLVFFHLTETNHGVVYRWTDGSIAPPQLAFVQEEAMSFCESMGFMMDNLNFTLLANDKKAELLATLPPFVSDLSTLVKEQEVVQESAAKKKVDPLEDFVRMKQARAESGQVGTGEFFGAQGEPIHEPVGGSTGGPVFDPSKPVSRADAPNVLPDGDVQIEITEIDGLELLTDGQLPIAALNPDLADPPVVRGSIAPPSPAPAAASPVVSVSVMDSEPGDVPARRPREKTPPGSIDILGAEFAAAEAKPAPVARGVLPNAAPAAELSIDDMLADVGNDAPGEDDLSHELDSILDRVENTNPPVAEPPLAVSSGADDDIQIDLGLGGPDDDPLSLLDSLVPAKEAKPAAPTQAPTVPAAAAPKRPSAPPAAAPSPLDSLANAWMDGGGTNARANGNGAHGAGPTPGDISTEDLARLLAML